MALSRLRGPLAVIAIACLGTAAAAECRGPSFVDSLDPAKREGLRAAVAAVPYGEGLLWSAERDGARVLLAGTMHLPDPRHEALLAALAPAIRDANLVLLEVTPSEEAAMTRALAERPEIAVITNGPTLLELLSPEDWDLVAAAARERGIPPFLAAKYRPWLLMMTLALPACALPGMAEGGGGLDHMIMEVAQAEGTPMAALEPWDTLFGLLGTGTMEEQLDLLRLSLLEPGSAEAVFVAMTEGYFAGRIAEVWKISRLSADLTPVGPAGAQAFEMMDDALLGARNRAWVPVIEEAAAAHPRVLVAAGASHLPGEEGVLRLLEVRGWRITRLDRGACCEGFWESP